MNSVVETVETATDVCEILQNAGHQAVFAGGCVRDLLLGVEPKDIDIATSATPEQVEALFPKTVAVGKSFGVIRVIHDGEEFEVATFRNDGKYSDGRRPDNVTYGNMQEDAFRRDLTINAMFLDPIANKMHDFVFGERDLKDRIIRFVGNPDARIEEDKLRMLRVIRFASRGGWAVNADTAAAVFHHAHLIDVVSKERIADELSKIFCNKKGYEGYDRLSMSNLWRYVMPIQQEKKVYEALRIAGDKLLNNKVLAWAIVLGSQKEDKARQILSDLRFDGDTISSVVNIIELSSLMVNAKVIKGSERMKLIANKNFDNMMEFILAYGYDEAYEYLARVRESTPISQIKPDNLVDGNDLIAAGLKPGKLFKEILAKVKDEQREGQITTREQALKLVGELIIAEKKLVLDNA